MKPTVMKLQLLYFPSKSNRRLQYQCHRGLQGANTGVYTAAEDHQLKHLTHQRTTSHLRENISSKSVKYTSDSHMLCSEAVNMAVVQHIGADTGSVETITMPCH